MIPPENLQLPLLSCKHVKIVITEISSQKLPKTNTLHREAETPPGLIFQPQVFQVLVPKRGTRVVDLARFIKAPNPGNLDL